MVMILAITKFLKSKNLFIVESILQLPSGFRNFLCHHVMVLTNNIGIEIAINNVCICAKATDNAIPLAVPINIEKNVPAHVGHAMNNPCNCCTYCAHSSSFFRNMCMH